MANFILPAITATHLDYIGIIKNNPVNIDLCTELIKKMNRMVMVKNTLSFNLKDVM